jgi:hypothetical protein
MFIQYILVTAFFTWIVLFLYIKIRFPFWNLQPVFHTYDYWRYFYWTPFIIYKYLPIKTKYCDFDQVKTIPYLECSQKDKTDTINLLQCYYLKSDRILHTVNTEYLHHYMTGYNEPTYISLYKDKHYSTTDISGNTTIIVSETPIGCIVSRPANVFFRPTLKEDIYTKSPIYYMDFLCVHRDKDIKTISRKLLQTHEYNQRKKNPSVLVTLIKKEVDLFAGVIPCVSFDTTTFYLRNINFPPTPPHFQIVRVLKENLDLLANFLYIQTHADFKFDSCFFDLCVIPDLGSLLSLIKAELLYVYCMKRDDQIYGIYFIKDLKTQFEDVEGETLHCIASVSNSNNPGVFYLGFLHSLQHIIKDKKTYKMLLFEGIGHNLLLLDSWQQKHTPIFKTATAYYLFNYIYPRTPLSPERCLILL